MGAGRWRPLRGNEACRPSPRIAASKRRRPVPAASCARNVANWGRDRKRDAAKVLADYGPLQRQTNKETVSPVVGLPGDRLPILRVGVWAGLMTRYKGRQSARAFERFRVRRRLLP
jgi:hypothetical protein